MKASDDLQWMLIASLSPSCALPLPPEPSDGVPDQTRGDEPPLSHWLALGAGVVLAVLPILVAALA
ncbi:hypothetical protein Sp245p_23195 (plasmid) [Azospirillum baldaniorum]|uniref:Uncharacterized protein n=1 Tax=Azospirillum baldaniorum TaxID=1064539 RepID=A0A9P1JZC5_9PROT|nr:hypothetical protein [Azospirillum baldaniorum]AWJ92757.1 hypothetical protein Sp245p_23195 [Azospirillum baldaniorum]NUB05008.1 hypothetical protein [Azospirillum baldaniorum]TWA78170.1 hypothetical protein FBZ85_106330 [Azospirillum brasilense]CCD02712.1 protein of unknown function [Azospirillum baldaniorum]